MNKRIIKTIHVGHFLLSLGKGGMENGVVKLVNEAQSPSFRHTIIIMTSDLSLAHKITNADVNVITIGRSHIIRNAFRLANVVKTEKIDVLHARGWPTMFEAGLVKLSIPGLKAVFGFHGRSFQELRGVGIARRAAQIILARIFDRINTLTPRMGREMMKEFLIPEDKIAILRNGVPKRTNQSTDRLALRDKFNIGSSEVVFGFVGRLDEVKRIDVLLEAFEILYRNEQIGYLVIVGEGPMLEKLQNYTMTFLSKKRIIYYGYCDDILDLYSMFDIYVQSSDYEGLSNTILEAMSCGLPVICTDVGGNNDLIDSGVNGYIVKKGNYREIAMRMNELICNEQQISQMGRLNKERYRSLYSIDAMVKSYLEYYTSLFSENSFSCGHSMGVDDYSAHLDR